KIVGQPDEAAVGQIAYKHATAPFFPMLLLSDLFESTGRPDFVVRCQCAGDRSGEISCHTRDEYFLPLEHSWLLPCNSWRMSETRLAPVPLMRSLSNCQTTVDGDGLPIDPFAFIGHQHRHHGSDIFRLAVACAANVRQHAVEQILTET